MLIYAFKQNGNTIYKIGSSKNSFSAIPKAVKSECVIDTPTGVTVVGLSKGSSGGGGSVFPIPSNKIDSLFS